MREITWQDLIEDCFEAPGYSMEAPACQDSAKVMIRMAYRSAVTELDVLVQMKAWLIKNKCPQARLDELDREFALIWRWATPLRKDQADDNLESARVALKETLQYLEHGKELEQERSRMQDLVQQAQSDIKAAREVYGVQMQIAECDLEVDPASGREVYVVRDASTDSE